MFCKWCCNGNKAGSLIVLGGTDSPSHISCMLLFPPRYSVPHTFHWKICRLCILPCSAWESCVWLVGWWLWATFSLSHRVHSGLAEEKNRIKHALEAFCSCVLYICSCASHNLCFHCFLVLKHSGSQKAEPLTKILTIFCYMSTGFPSFPSGG